MSDYISLEELKKLDEGQLFSRWCSGGKFPFDSAICGRCVTLHGSFFGGHFQCEEHLEFGTNAHTILPYDVEGDLRTHLEAIYSLRLFYKDLYASNPPEIETLEVAPVEDHVKVG